MGVPSFFRWLVKKYPKIVTDVIEPHYDSTSTDLSELDTHIDLTTENPNGFETDNLYLDMNGIIHPCCHPEDASQPLTEDIMIYNIFRYIDRIFAIVRPRKLLYMAIDGVAPRAKMNQQRQRRFRAAREIYDKQQIESKLRQQWSAEGKKLPAQGKQPWDTAAITPGTPFMYKLSVALRYYIQLRISTQPAWQSIKVLFSDGNVPGEGEHKIMKYIRLQRAQPGYDPNTSHVMYGMDADLIMLGLAAHDPHFRIIREVITETAVTPKCSICNRGHWTSDCTGEEWLNDPEVDISKPDTSDKKVSHTIYGRPFQFLHINVLREYLSYDLYVDPTTLPWSNGVFNIERAIDDFVFLCFFVGNDFLPHLPTLEIREGAIDALVYLYKRYLPSMNGYITDSGHVDLQRASIIMHDISKLEDTIFQRRKQKEQRQQQQKEDAQIRVNKIRADNKAREAADKANATNINTQHLTVLGAKHVNTTEAITSSGPQANLTAAAKLKALLAKHSGKRSADDTSNDDKNTTNNTQSNGTTDNKPNGTATAAPYQFKHIKPVTQPVKKAKIEENEAVVTKTDDTTANGDTTHNNNTDTTTPIKTDADNHTATVKTEPTTSKSSDSSDSDKEDEAEHLLPDIKIQAKEEALYAAKFKELMKPIQEPTQQPDTIEYGELGWKQRYYASKLHIDPNSTTGQATLNSMFESYACGLAWVLLYYYEDCASWSWYYPYHYSPMASNLTELGQYQPIKFMKSQPFKPFEQLLGVLPPTSAHNVPNEYAKLMTDKKSPLADLYPLDFEIDLNGKKYQWQAIALLPWIDEQKLLKEARKLEPTLSELEKIRNQNGNEILYVHITHALGTVMQSMYEQKSTPTEQIKQTLNIDVGDISGSIETYNDIVLPGGTVTCDLQVDNITLPTIDHNKAISAVYHLPSFLPHNPNLIPGVTLPDTVLTTTDLDEQERGKKGFLLQLLQPNQYNNNKRYNQYEQPWQSNATTGNNVYNQPYNNNNQQQQPCIHYQRHGNCNRGDACKFSHNATPATQPTPQYNNNYQPSHNANYNLQPHERQNPYQQYGAYNQPPVQQQYGGYNAQQPLVQYAQQQQRQPTQQYAQSQYQPLYQQPYQQQYGYNQAPYNQYQQMPQQPYAQQYSQVPQQSYGMLPQAPTQPQATQQPYTFQHPTYKR